MPATESRIPAQGGPHTVEGFRTDVLRIIEAYPHQPVFPLFVQLRELRERALKALERRNPEERSQQLLHTTGLICAAMTNAAFDQGQSSAAEGQARTAHRCAELAGDQALRCWIRGTEALIAYWDERYQDAVDLAADGRRFVPGSGTALVRLAAVEARAHAHLGDAAAAEQALARAAVARAEVGGPDEPGGLLEFPLPKQQAYAATTELWLGGRERVARAERAAAEAIGGYLRAPADKRRIGELCLARLDLAAVRIARDDLDGAGEQIGEVLTAAAGRRTEEVVRRLRQLVRALHRTRHQSAPEAIELRERIGAFCAARGVSPLVNLPV
ncbi:hypothetical protein GCM10009854_34590 [Saccharopolyspora halophila]|uniref:Transcriptional regulator n=1 Tax=Saccharopolyspora halophila TaxID=405551 RepID=A0ABN3GKD3_9PSEU